MTREEQFEQMLDEVRSEYAAVCAKMDRLKSENRVKTATYRELLGNKLMLKNILSRYRSHGLISEGELHD